MISDLAAVRQAVSAACPRAGQCISLSIRVDATRALRLERGTQRDGEEMRDQWLDWMASEEEWASVEDPRARADFVISGGRAHPSAEEPERLPKL